MLASAHDMVKLAGRRPIWPESHRWRRAW